MTELIVCRVVWEFHTSTNKKEIWKEFCSVEIDSDDLRDHDAICKDELINRKTKGWKLVEFYVLPTYHNDDNNDDKTSF